VQRLQDTIRDTSRDVDMARSRDSRLASQLQAELDDARDEASYLKVKLRKGEPVSRRDFDDLSDRVARIRDNARGETSAAAPIRSRNPDEIPVGTEFDVRLQSSLSSDTARVEDRFEATTMVDLQDERGRVLVPAGALMRGLVSSVTKTTHTERTGRLTLTFDRITFHGTSYPIHATVEQAIESEGVRGEAGKIGVGAGAGAIIGALLGGGKGAVAGLLIGGGGTIAATEGKDVEVPAGTVLRVRLDSGLDLRRE
jgi:hypothetical protein